VILFEDMKQGFFEMIEVDGRKGGRKCRRKDFGGVEES
jgi:hypothetical protein